MYELSSKLNLSFNTKSVQYLVIIIDLKKPNIKDRKNTVNIKGELMAERKITMKMSFIF